MCRASAIPMSGAGTLDMCSQRTEWFPVILLAALVGGCGILDPDTPEPTWTSLGLDGEAVRSLAQTPWGLYAGTDSSGVFLRDAATGTWQQAGLVDEGVINDLLYVPTVPPRLLAAMGPWRGETVDAVVFASEDGETWAPSDGGYADAVEFNPTGYSLAYDPTEPRVVYVGLSYKVMKSTDGGTTWRFVLGDTTSTWAGYVPSIFVESGANIWLARNYTGPSTSFVPGGTVYHSTDGGLSWRSMVPFSSHQSLLSDVYAAPDGRLWLLLTIGVMFSADGGETWVGSLSSVTMGRPVGGLGHTTQIIPAGDTLYVISRLDGYPGELDVFRLRPGSMQWDAIRVRPGITGGLSATLDDEGRLLVGTAGTGVWRMEW